MPAIRISRFAGVFDRPRCPDRVARVGAQNTIEILIRLQSALGDRHRGCQIVIVRLLKHDLDVGILS